MLNFIARWRLKQQRRRHRGTTQAPSKSEPNPLFPGAQTKQHSRWRSRLLVGLQVGTFALLWYSVMLSPLFSITDVTVKLDGSVRNSAAIQSAANALLKKKTFFFFPNNNYIILRPLWFGTQLREEIAHTIGVEQIEVTKAFPHTLKVVVQAKTPAFIWRTSHGDFLIDEDGNAVGSLEENSDENAEPHLPMIEDENAIPTTVGNQVLQKEVLQAIRTFYDALAPLHPIAHIRIPKLTCKDIAQEQREAGEADDEEDNTNAAANNNTNTKLRNTNSTDASEVVIDEPACDLTQLVFYAPEFRVVTQAGWEVYVQSKEIDLQFNKLLRVLQDPSIHPETLQYIDVRFGERVYLQ